MIRLAMISGQSVRSQPLPQDEVSWFTINKSERVTRTK